MSSASTATVNQPPQEPSNLAAFLSYVVPGLGQIYQGRYGKGVLFMVSLLSMFMLGQAMGQWQNVHMPTGEEAGQIRGGRRAATSLVTRWHFLGQFWIGAAAWPAIWQFYDMPVPSEDANPFLHNYQRAPNEAKLNEFLKVSDKTPDLGWVYTVVAGMLNILVMYDAYTGTIAHRERKESGKPEQKKEGAA